MTGLVDASTPGAAPLAARVAIAVMVALALLQGAVFIFTGATVHRTLGLSIAAMSCVFGLWPHAVRYRVWILALLAAAGLANFIVHIVVAVEPYQVRFLQACVGYAYAAFTLAGIASLLLRSMATGMLLTGLTMTLGLVGADIALQVYWPGFEGWTSAVVRWVGGTVPDPVLDERYAPNSEARTIYVSNPRGYFRTTDSRQSRWQLGVHHGGSSARLAFPDGDGDGADMVRVEIDRAEVPTPWHIQLAFTRVGVRAEGSNYVVAFQARAEHPRVMSVSVGQSRPPWQPLGLYTDVDLGSEWRDYVLEFQPKSSDEEARLNFNLGAASGTVEIRAVQVKMIRSGTSVVREVRPEFYVSYRFNDQGCRGADLPIPAPPGRRRVLVLGDSYTVGVGVHEEDTFAVRLQKLLNAEAARSSAKHTYDVANCGVSGYDTTQERKLFEVLAPIYRPQMVVLVMVGNDYISWREEVAKGYFHKPTKYERLFFLWGALQITRHEGRRPAPDFSRSMREILLLNEHCKRIGARLAVVAFRNFPIATPDWANLVQTVSTGLAGSGIPWADLGERILDGISFQSSFVHPGGDFHPNEVAHESAAKQIAELLLRNGLLD